MESEDSAADNFKKLIMPGQKQQISKSQWQWKHQDCLALHQSLEAIASSLSILSDSLGTAVEVEGLSLVVETKATELEKPPMKFIAMPNNNRDDSHLEASSSCGGDVAVVMTTKAKWLLRELKSIKADLAFTRDRCAQLEEENRRLRDGAVYQNGAQEEDDLVSLQLETLLVEKSRLAQENATYVRENYFLHELLKYHQLSLQAVILDDNSLDETTMMGFDVDGPIEMD